MSRPEIGFLDKGLWRSAADVYREDIAELRALVSWVDGMCVDEAPHMEIRAGINRYYESRKQ